MLAPIRKQISSELASILSKAGISDVSLSEIEASLDIPKEEKFGDLSTHLVLKLAKALKKNPRVLADEISKNFFDQIQKTELKNRIEKVSVEGPGFINFYFSTKELRSVLATIQEQKENFAKNGLSKEQRRKILLEYVSANPTGPLTVAHGRQAALGDSLAKILRFCGHDVTTEYYNNDEGVQIETLGKSMQFRVAEILSGPQGEIPENYYRGDYLIDIAKQFLNEIGESKFKSMSQEEQAKLCRVYARDFIMKGIIEDLTAFGVKFDSYYSQEALAKSGKVEKTLKELIDRNVTKEEDGALWLLSTRWGDDKDRVLIKSDKNYTYLTPDIAYHNEKFKRGFEMLVDILGPDHHGYIARLKASQSALGHNADSIHVLIAQLVTLYEGTKQVRMSTRAGEFVTLRQILDEVGSDAGRFFFVMRKFDAHLDFDLALAKSQTPDNPVFYIQYAHARIESIKNTYSQKSSENFLSDATVLERLAEPAEFRLMRLLSQYEENLLGAARTFEPYRLVPYLMELAQAFHRFYTENRIVTEDEKLTKARLWLSSSVQSVIKSGLSLLGVSAPLKM